MKVARFDPNIRPFLRFYQQATQNVFAERAYPVTVYGEHLKK